MLNTIRKKFLNLIDPKVRKSAGSRRVLESFRANPKWEFPKNGVPYLGVLIIKILLFRVLY